VPADTLHVLWHEGLVVGRVVSAADGMPVPARLRLAGTPLTTRADKQGWFRFDHLVHLRTIVVAERMGFLPDSAVVETAPGTTDTLRLHLPINPVVLPDSVKDEP